MQPFKLQPVFKDYLWGGQRLKEEFGKGAGPAVIAESWELSAHPQGSSVVAGGPLAGINLADLFRAQRPLFGAACGALASFPILIKLIDAARSLSIQVHPNDAYAQAHEGEAGKTEMWVILDSAPGAFLYLGLAHAISRDEAARRIAEGSFEQVLQKVPVAKGDVFFLRPGVIHAIGAGILLAEVQQNSNSTYRLYDFGRLGADGKPRALHVEKGLDVASLTPAEYSAPGRLAPKAGAGHTLERLAACPYFTVHRLRLDETFCHRPNGVSFLSVLCLAGGATLAAGGAPLSIQKGDSVFVPANSPQTTLEGEGEFLLTEAGC